MRSVDFESFLIEIKLDRDAVPSFKEYPFSIPALRDLEHLEFHPKVTYLIGENGTGKSTLIEALAVMLRINPEGGSRNFNFGTRESHSVLGEFLRPVRSAKEIKDTFFLRAESFFNVATEVEQLQVQGYGVKSLHEQSHGESFLSLMTNRFSGNGVYLLDEPEAALSPTRQLTVLALMHELVKNNSQFIICTHSPILMAYPDSWIYQLSEYGIERVEYTDTEHYTVTKGFLDRREMMLNVILGEDEEP